MVVALVGGSRGLLGMSVWLVLCSSVSITSDVCKNVIKARNLNKKEKQKREGEGREGRISLSAEMSICLARLIE